MKIERRFQGVAVSPGIARGTAFVYRPDEELPQRRTVQNSDGEMRRLNEALVETRRQIVELQERVAASVGSDDAEIFDAHLMIVEDGIVIGEVEKMLRAEKCNVEHAFFTVTQRYAKSLSEMDDAYLRERAVDIADVARRVIHNLLGKEPAGFASLDAPRIILAGTITPGDTAQMNRTLVLGFATETGGKTSHTAIMARSFNIPAVVGLHDVIEDIEDGMDVLLDGYAGVLIVNPGDQTLYEYGEQQMRRRRVESELTQLRETSSTMKDGRHVVLSANIESPEDVAQVINSGAEGVGLFRTEFLFLNRKDLPTEAEQAAAYRRVADAVHPHAVIIRTLDLGGDKIHSTLQDTAEENPFLGWRAIRVCLERKDIFKVQLRAVLRASAGGNVKLMFPMISGLPELRQARSVLDECRDELRVEGVPFDEKMSVGIMIEVPSAALVADILAREVDFFSLGTNDLVQYTIAADRGNERIAHLYEPTHPAIVRLIKHTTDAAHAAGIWIGVCGEMGGDVVLTPLLLGLGVDEISCGAAVLPRVKHAVRSLDSETCTTLATRAVGGHSGSVILSWCEAVAAKNYPELL
jgi:phosphoenolpyruvate-protein phosphotransferase (PTS system enzyme I)